MGCKGLHCEGCQHGGGSKFAAGFGALVVLGGVLVYAGHRQAIDHAASVTGDVVLIVLFVAVGLAVALAAAVAGVRVHRVLARRRRERLMLAPPRVRVLPGAAGTVSPSALDQGRSWPVWPLAGLTPHTRPQLENGGDRDGRRR
jgi:hypothetical protein